MKVRLANKIMKHRSGCLYYELMRSKGLDVSKELPKIQQYWEPRWALYYASKGGCYGRVDHRIVKAEKITERYSRKLMNRLTRWAGKSPFEIRDTLDSANKLKKYDMNEEEKCCGNCLWFIDEDAYGVGWCCNNEHESSCDQVCSKHEF